MQQPRAGDRDFAEDSPQGKIVVPLAVSLLPAVGALLVCSHAVSSLGFHDHTLDRAEDGFAFRQSQAQRFHFKFCPLQGHDVLDLLLPAISHRNNADLEGHAATS
jgi:hypothetical protein